MFANKSQELHAKARAKLAGKPIPFLLDLWDVADTRADVPMEYLSQVRGWIMDELERRNPEAFERWMDADGAPGPEQFFREVNA